MASRQSQLLSRKKPKMTVNWRFWKNREVPETGGQLDDLAQTLNLWLPKSSVVFWEYRIYFPLLAAQPISSRPYRSPIIVPSYCRLTRTFVNRFQPRFSLYRKVGTVLVACFSFGNDMLPTTKPFKRNLLISTFFKIPVVHFYNPLPWQRSCYHSNVRVGFRNQKTYCWRNSWN